MLLNLPALELLTRAMPDVEHIHLLALFRRVVDNAKMRGRWP
jgi:hypothetical protein